MSFQWYIYMYMYMYYIMFCFLAPPSNVTRCRESWGGPGNFLCLAGVIFFFFFYYRVQDHLLKAMHIETNTFIEYHYTCSKCLTHLFSEIITFQCFDFVLFFVAYLSKN